MPGPDEKQERSCHVRTTIPPAETVAAPRAAPYTGDMDIGRPVPVPWWREAVRSWVPVLGIAAVLVFQMVSLQQQIGDLRTDFHREMGDLRTDMRTEVAGLRDELRTEMGILGERITRLETLLESRAER